MDIGLALPQYDFSVAGQRRLPWSTTLEWANAAERLGVDSLWLADHLFLGVEKYGGPPGDHFGFEPLTALGALAQATTSVRLGSLVLAVGLRPPAVLGKALATLDVVTGGRLIVGAGAGWNEPEYVAAGVPFGSPGERLHRLAGTIELWKAMWVGAKGAPPCHPGPRQSPHPPVWVGGKGDRMLRLVAEHADGWNTVWTWTIETYRDRAAVLDRACESFGRDPASVTRSIGLYTLVGSDESDLQRRFERLQQSAAPGVVPATLDEWRPGHLVGTVEQVREQVAAWADVGVSTVIIGLGALPFAVTSIDDLEMVAVATGG